MTETLRWTPTLFEAQSGAFSSAKRYVRKAASGGYAMSSGATTTGRYVFVSSNNKGVSYRFDIGLARDWTYSLNIGGTEYPAPDPTPVVETVEV